VHSVDLEDQLTRQEVELVTQTRDRPVADTDQGAELAALEGHEAGRTRDRRTDLIVAVGRDLELLSAAAVDEDAAGDLHAHLSAVVLGRRDVGQLGKLLQLHLTLVTQVVGHETTRLDARDLVVQTGHFARELVDAACEHFGLLADLGAEFGRARVERVEAVGQLQGRLDQVGLQDLVLGVRRELGDVREEAVQRRAETEALEVGEQRLDLGQGRDLLVETTGDRGLGEDATLEQLIDRPTNAGDVDASADGEAVGELRPGGCELDPLARVALRVRSANCDDSSARRPVLSEMRLMSVPQAWALTNVPLARSGDSGSAPVSVRRTSLTTLR
jgi:hypothetical protein